jgi:hypothetical protein
MMKVCFIKTNFETNLKLLKVVTENVTVCKSLILKKLIITHNFPNFFFFLARSGLFYL